MPFRKKAVETQIDENLKRIFQEDLECDLPPHLAELLDRLDQIELPVRTGENTTGEAKS